MDAQKKKVIAVATLSIAVIAVGVFQFTSNGAPPPDKKKSAAKKDGGSSTIVATGNPDDPSSRINKLVAENTVDENNPASIYTSAPLDYRDPFNQGLAKLPDAPNATPPPSQNVTKPQRIVRNIGGQNFGGSGDSWQEPGGKPIGIDGPIPPMPGAGGPNGTAMVKDPNAFNMTPIGIITGSRPAAVFLDDSGNQRLVSLGGSLGEKSTVIGIEKNKVRVRHHDKILTFNVGGTPNDK